MGKSDQQKTQANITDKVNQDNNSTNEGIADTQNRAQTLQGRADTQNKSIWDGYSSLASDPNHGIDQSASDRLLSGNYSSVGGTAGGSSGGSGGGSTGAGSGSGSYLDTYNELRGKTGGFDPTRLGNIDKASGSLYDTSGNYGDVNKNISALSDAKSNYGATEASVGGLQKFASTGGLNSDQLGNINRSSLTDMEKTGGYSDADIANERARGNAGIASTYSNLNDTLSRQRAVSGQAGPGISATGFKLARQSAQDTASQAQKTEADIHERVNANKMAAGTTLGNLGLGTAGLQSQNTLSGYNDAGNLDIGKNTAIQSAEADAGKLGLGRQSQIDAATEAGAGIDQNTQSLINNTRLGAANGQSQDTLGRMSIGASSSAAANSLAAENQRFLIGEGDANRNTGLGGMLNTYQAAPSDLNFNQSLLRGYRQDQAGNSQNTIQDRIGASRIPGIGSTIGAGLDVAGKAFGLASGLSGGLQNFNSNAPAPSGGPSGYNPAGGLVNPNMYRPTSVNPFQSYGANY